MYHWCPNQPKRQHCQEWLTAAWGFMASTIAPFHMLDCLFVPLNLLSLLMLYGQLHYLEWSTLNQTPKPTTLQDAANAAGFEITLIDNGQRNVLAVSYAAANAGTLAYHAHSWDPVFVEEVDPGQKLDIDGTLAGQVRRRQGWAHACMLSFSC